MPFIFSGAKPNVRTQHRLARPSPCCLSLSALHAPDGGGRAKATASIGVDRGKRQYGPGRRSRGRVTSGLYRLNCTRTIPLPVSSAGGSCKGTRQALHLPKGRVLFADTVLLPVSPRWNAGRGADATTCGRLVWQFDIWYLAGYVVGLSGSSEKRTRHVTEHHRHRQ